MLGLIAKMQGKRMLRFGIQSPKLKLACDRKKFLHSKIHPPSNHIRSRKATARVRGGLDKISIRRIQSPCKTLKLRIPSSRPPNASGAPHSIRCQATRAPQAFLFRFKGPANVFREPDDRAPHRRMTEQGEGWDLHVFVSHFLRSKGASSAERMTVNFRLNISPIFTSMRLSAPCFIAARPKGLATKTP